LHLPQDEERLLQYLDGQLSALDARAAEAHLAVCPECQGLRRQWAQLDEKLAGVLAQPTLSPGFAGRLREQVAAGLKAGALGVRVGESGGWGAELHDQWPGTLRGEPSLLWLGLLDVLGYGAAAAVGGCWLFHLAIAWVSGPPGGGAAFLRGPAFLIALVAAGAALLVGVNLAVKNRVLRWVVGL
jgi:hypothetical protein